MLETVRGAMAAAKSGAMVAATAANAVVATANAAVIAGVCRAKTKLASERGQGTTEYAILVGVLVVIAIIAITVFRPKLQELWNAIAEGISGL